MGWPKVLSCAAVLGGLAPMASATEDLGDADAGKAVFAQCKGCHEVGDGAENKIGRSPSWRRSQVGTMPNSIAYRFHDVPLSSGLLGCIS